MLLELLEESGLPVKEERELLVAEGRVGLGVLEQHRERLEPGKQLVL